MKSFLKMLAISGALAATAACHNGNVRALNDTLDQLNGYSVTYPDQQNTQYISDVEWTQGVKSGSGFHSMRNTGDELCFITIIYENDETEEVQLGAGKSLFRWHDLYNQPNNVSASCIGIGDIVGW